MNDRQPRTLAIKAPYLRGAFFYALLPVGTSVRAVPAMPRDELTRSEQRLLIRLFGGGSLRNQNAADIEGLRWRGFIDDEQNLSMPGLLVLTLAMRER
jgi:hypothetical protein